MMKRVNVDQLLADFKAAAEKAGFNVATYGVIDQRPLYAFTRSAAATGSQGKRIYISTGIHGDEPAPPMALLSILQNNTLPLENDYYICPCMNPSGLAIHSRENSEGIDLNRDFSDFKSREIELHHEWVKEQIDDLDMAIHLHEDWEASGFYLYEINFGEVESRADSILQAAAAWVPIEIAVSIDGHSASGGIIRPPANHDVPEGLPEALFFQRRFNLLNYTLETPSSLELTARVQAMQAALLSALGS